MVNVIGVRFKRAGKISRVNTQSSRRYAASSTAES